jgi:hypothetical protein
LSVVKSLPRAAILATLSDARRHALRSHEEKPMPYQIAGIDVHKKMLAVVVPTSRSRATTTLKG